MHKVYYWTAKPNFGDALNAWILDRLGAEHELATPDEADLIMVGSILHHLPAGWSGAIAGAGLLYPDMRVDLTAAKVVALRGKLTLAAASLAPGTRPILGDPGLMVPLWVQQPPAKYELGVIPHWSDTELFKRFAYGHLIDPGQEPGKVATEIAMCKRVVSSSLHGLILADAFGIPRRAELFAQSVREGGDFKFRDYASIYDGDPHFGEFWTAPRDVVHRTRTALRQALSAAGIGRPANPPPPVYAAPPRGWSPPWWRRPEVSLLVPFRDDGEHRSRVWHWLRRYWRAHLEAVEIVQGHDGLTPFSKSVAVNDAASRARGRVFAIVDADAYMDSDALETCIDNVLAATRAGERLWYMPYRRLYRLNQQVTEQILGWSPVLPYMLPSPPPESWLENTHHESHYGHQYGAMMMVMPREAFFEVGGMDPGFRGWGGEDASFMRALDTLYCLHEVADNDLCHMWHERPGHDYRTRRWRGQESLASGPANSRLAHRYAQAGGHPGFMRALVDEQQRFGAPRR